MEPSLAVLRTPCRCKMSRDDTCDLGTAVETQICFAIPAADVVVLIQLVVGLLALCTMHLPILLVVQHLHLGLHPQQCLGIYKHKSAE